MKILTLELEGFGPFKTRQHINFGEAASGGILLITGPTGAGKSSLLDAVSFALYGAVPRYDGQPHRVRSDHLAPEQSTTVKLTFEMMERRFLVERQPEWHRPKQRGEGTTLQKQEAKLWEWDDQAGDWQGLAARPTDVAALLRDIVGLSHVQFLQVVLLAQGGFQKFLHADDQDRQATLRTLFQTERFAEVERLLVERRQELSRTTDHTLQRIHDQLAGLEADLQNAWEEFGAAPEVLDTETEEDGGGPAELDGVDHAASVVERRTRVAAELTRIEKRAAILQKLASQAVKARDVADAQVQATRVTAARQQRRTAAEHERAELDAKQAAIDGDRSALAAATRAAAVLPCMDRHTAAEARHRSLRDEQREAQTLFHSAAAELLTLPAGFSAKLDDRTDWRAHRELLVDSLIKLEDATSTEQGIEGREATLQSERQSQQKLSEGAKRLGDRAAELPELLREARARFAETAELAAHAPEREAAVARAQQVRDAAEELKGLGPKLREAQEISLTHAGAVAGASETVRDLMSRRMRSMAGELAENLEPGQPCEVCGAREHPSPATLTRRITDEDLDYAEARERKATHARNAAVTAERELETKIAAATERADGLSVTDATKQLRLAEGSREASQRAAQRTAEMQAAIDHLEHEHKTVATTERDARDALLEAEHRIQAISDGLANDQAMLARVRGDYASVAARSTAERAVRDSIDRLLEIDADLRAANISAEETDAELRQALAEHNFETVEQVTAAARIREERDDLRERIERFDSERARVTGVLNETELQDLPAEPAPLSDHETAYQDAASVASETQLAAAAIERVLHDGARKLNAVDRDIAESAESAEKLLKLRRLVDTVQGKDPNTRKMRLEVFVLAARLEAIVLAANRRLEHMVGGRYTLEHDDSLRSRGRQSGLSLRVMDAYTGRHRTPASLSGGETFLASLALALGLADVVSAEVGGVSLDMLFVDEGFGSLDPDALDEAMATLDGLREGGRSVILISHVAELKERIPGQLTVAVDGHGASTVTGAGTWNT